MLKKLLHAGLALALTSGLAFAAFNLGFDGKIIPQQTTSPALTSCGTSPAIVGTDVAGKITTGSAATTCTATFAVAYATAPFCVVSTQGAATQPTYTVTNVAIVMSVDIASTSYNYICIAANGG